MTKTDIINSIHEKAREITTIRKAQVEAAYNATWQVLRDIINNAHKLKIDGFGTFEVRDRAEGVGRNIRTGEIVPVPPTKVVHFTADRAFKKQVKAGD